LNEWFHYFWVFLAILKMVTTTAAASIPAPQVSLSMFNERVTSLERLVQ